MDGLQEMVIPLSPLHYIMLPKTLNYKICLWNAKTLLRDIQGFCLLKDCSHDFSISCSSKEDLYKVGVTDAAANMKKAITESKEVSNYLTCADHLLNACLTKAVEKLEGLNA